MISNSTSTKQTTTAGSTHRAGISGLFEQSPYEGKPFGSPISSTTTSFSLRLGSSSSVDPTKVVTPTASLDRIAPRALLRTTNVTAQSATHFFRVVYSDRGKINRRTINSRDVLVTGVGGYRQLARLVNVRLNRAGTSATATYRINAAGGSWDDSDNGAYTVSMLRGQVSDISRNFVRAGRLGRFQVAVPQSPTPGPTSPPPTASLTASNFVPDGATTYSFAVTYADDSAVSAASLGNGDVRVTGPGGFNQLATFVGVSPTGDGTPRTVTYSITAPGGSWDTADLGTYTVSLEPNQVSDTSNNFAVAGTLGTFAAVGEIQPPTVSGFAAPTITANAGDAQFTVTYADNAGIVPTSVGNGDIRVTGPNGFNQIASFVSFNANSNVATYRIGAPGGSWSAFDNGNYTVAVEAGQIVDINGNAIAPATAGTFSVNLSGTDDSSNGSGTGNNTINGGTGNDTVNYTSASIGVMVNLQTGRTVKPIYDGALSNTIMPLGDSITAGQHTVDPVQGAYRIQLYENFVSDGFAVDFVGSQINGPTSNFDRNHEGYPGETIDDIRGRIQNGSISFDPQLNAVLLMIGTNDTGSEFVSNAEMVDDLSDLIDAITARTNALVVVSSILPLANGTRNSRAQTYNSSIPGLVNTKVSQGKRVTFANVGGALTTGDLNSDGIHPTAAGYDELGTLWYNAITDRDTLTSIENVIGTNLADTIIGNGDANIITGGGGSDRLGGGNGADTFVYRNAAEGGDTIIDFTSSDFIQISAAGFGSGLVAGTSLSTTASATGVLVNGATAISNDPTFLYSGGTLSFDADGAGAGAAVTIAVLSGGPATLTTSQFNIVA
ncbi:hypothetical protein H6G89_10900 [Oscillatoria sp. FACHB-1407]|uniref:SGNH/GDSL hydrolase family protein n=1 Tax=Oscillatoria sp. FACHB-1407 TaxID=2692847 RepID=UPI00168766B2|nr:SGNH/GDSL hydrolase family protein [Oscillatoria sp. FACHB-1407]MBD2461557.1 hypothetical protein [Oscillatoria sp. FACHB-1407]